MWGGGERGSKEHTAFFSAAHGLKKSAAKSFYGVEFNWKRIMLGEPVY